MEKPLGTEGARTLLVTKGIATRSKDATRGAPGLTTRSKKLCLLFDLVCDRSALSWTPSRGADEATLEFQEAALLVGASVTARRPGVTDEVRPVAMLWNAMAYGS